MDQIIQLLFKYKSLLSYAFFGVCTTMVNIAVYQMMYGVICIENVPATVVAWIVAVLFAFITNKLFVFDSKSFELSVLRYEIPAFFGCRLLTGVLDVAIMFVAVDVMGWNGVLWKVIANVLVIVLNYVASKLVIFKEKSKN